MKYLELFRSEFEKRTTFTINDVRKVLSQKGINPNYVKTLIHHLLKKGEIKKVKKGIYTFKEDLEVVGFAFQPFYYGLQESLSIRNLWEQETTPVIITIRKVRQGTRKFLGNNYSVRLVDRKMFFGWEMVKYYDYWIPVSDVEKTLIDFVYFRQGLGQESLEEIKTKIRKKVLIEYLNRVPKWVKKRVLRLLKYG